MQSNFFTDLERTLINFIWEHKNPKRAKAILYNSGYSRGITIPDFKLNYKNTVLKTAWYWHKNRKVNLCNRIWDPDINPQTYEHLIFNKGAKGTQWKNDSIINKLCWHNWMSTCRRMTIHPYLSPWENWSPNGLKTTTLIWQLWTW